MTSSEYNTEYPKDNTEYPKDKSGYYYLDQNNKKVYFLQDNVGYYYVGKIYINKNTVKA